MYVAAYSVEGIGNPSIDKHALEAGHLPKTVMPEIPDLFIMAGAIGAMILLYMMASRLFPIMNFWEQRELQLYDKGHVPYHRGYVQNNGQVRVRVVWNCRAASPFGVPAFAENDER